MEATDVLTDPLAFSCGMRTNEQAVTVKTEPKDIEDLVVPTQFEQLTALGFGHMYDFDNLPELDPVYDFNCIKSEPGMFMYEIFDYTVLPHHNFLIIKQLGMLTHTQIHLYAPRDYVLLG
jgi:hypothetical protein